MNNLPDIIDYNLKILFIGFNPGIRSAETGHHYASYSNNFWRLLYDSGLAPYKIVPQEDAKLLEFGYGSTNIVSRPTKSAADISSSEFKEGGAALKELLAECKPHIACYVGLGVYKVFSGLKSIACGFQDSSVVDGILDYVCPSPSGLNRMPYSTQLECFSALNRFLKQEKAHP